MTPVRRGIDEARGAFRRDVEVASPEIAVQPRGWLLGSHERGEACEQPLEAATHRARGAALLFRASELWLEPLGLEKIRPARMRAVRLRQAPDEVVVVETERGRRRAMERCEGTAKLLVEGAATRTRLDELEHEEAHAVVADGHHLGNVQRARLGEPGEAARFGL